MRSYSGCCAKRAIETVLDVVKKWNGTVRFHLSSESGNLAYGLARCLQYSGCTAEDATPLQLLQATVVRLEFPAALWFWLRFRQIEYATRVFASLGLAAWALPWWLCLAESAKSPGRLADLLDAVLTGGRETLDARCAVARLCARLARHAARRQNVSPQIWRDHVLPFLPLNFVEAVLAARRARENAALAILRQGPPWAAAGGADGVMRLLSGVLDDPPP